MKDNRYPGEEDAKPWLENDSGQRSTIDGRRSLENLEIHARYM